MLGIVFYTVRVLYLGIAVLYVLNVGFYTAGVLNPGHWMPSALWISHTAAALAILGVLLACSSTHCLSYSSLSILMCGMLCLWDSRSIRDWGSAGLGVCLQCGVSDTCTSLTCWMEGEQRRDHHFHHCFDSNDSQDFFFSPLLLQVMNTPPRK